MIANKIDLKLTKSQYTKINKYIDKVNKGTRPRRFTLILIEPSSKYSWNSGNLLVGYMQSENNRDINWLNKMTDNINDKIRKSKRQ